MRDPVLRLVGWDRWPLCTGASAGSGSPRQAWACVRPAAAGLKKVCWGLDKPRQPRGGWKGAAGASPDVCWGGWGVARVGCGAGGGGGCGVGVVVAG